MTTNDNLLTREQLADLLHVRPATISGWSRRGTIPSVRFSRKVIRFRLEDVVAALAVPARTAHSSDEAEGGDHV